MSAEPKPDIMLTEVVRGPAPDAIGIEAGDVRIVAEQSKEERALVRKMDLTILPLLSGTVLFAYLV